MDTLLKGAVVGGAVAVGAGTTILGVPAAVGALGFGAGGIASGSTAAWMMGLAGGATKAGSIVAICQSIGAAGVSTSTAVLGSTLGGIAGFIMRQ